MTNRQRSCLLGLVVWSRLLVPGSGFQSLVVPGSQPRTVSRCESSVPPSSTQLCATADDFVAGSAAVSVEELENIFSKSSNKRGEISKKKFSKLPLIKELLDDDDLSVAELNEIWGKHASGKTAAFDSFAKIYREIDDLFEEDEDEDEEEEEDDDEDVLDEGSDEIDTQDDAISVDDEEENDDDDATTTTEFQLSDDAEARAELESIFKVISNSDKLVSKDALWAWDEIETLIADGMLGKDEFEDLWNKSPKSSDDSLLDFEGFLQFNTQLDNLFDFDDEEMDDDDDEIPAASMVDDVESDVAAEEAEAEDGLFSSLAGASGLITLADLSAWSELNEMLEDGDILQEEIEQMYADALTQSQDASALDAVAFDALQTAIDDLFEDEEDDGDDEEDVSAEPSVAAAPEEIRTSKSDLLRALELMSGAEEQDERLPCGLESTEREDKLILNLANKLAGEESNLIIQRQGDIDTKDVAGTWELLYTSSAAMRFNKGLSGIGGSFPSGKFAGLTQSLAASQLLPDVEYQERIEVNPSSASFNVAVNGHWELRRSVSLFTGERSIVLAIEPERVMYGPTSTKADHWKSLGPTNMLDVAYLDDDLRIMRGSTSMDTILIFQRIS